MVSEPQSQVEEEGEMLGPEHRDGRVWAVWGHGEAFDPPTGVHPQVCQGWHHGVVRSLAAR